MRSAARGGRSPAGAKRSFDYMRLYQATPTERISVIRAGVPASDVKRLGVELHLDQQVMFGALNLKTATVNRKAARNEALSTEDSERVVGLAKLVGQIEAMIQESGNPDGFDAPGWLSLWLREPLPALGGNRPINLLDTMEGQALVSRTLAQMQSVAYA